jgi:S1-C subfamily serine protease
MEDHFVWTCPSCQRRVPTRVDACRCGFVRAEALAAPPSAPSPAAPERDGRGPGLAVLVIALILAGVALTLWGHTTLARTPRPSAAIALAAPPQPTPAASDAPAAPEDTTATPQPPDTPAEDPATPPKLEPLEDIVSRILPAVAAIEAGRARGTGFFVQPDTVLTNAHVIDGQSSVRLQVGSTSYTARVATVSAGADLAVLKVYNASPNQAVLSLGSAGGARVGEEVVAVGSALGVLSNTVTRGIVSAFRKVGDITLVQTDAAINPGNSGGPLVTRDGVVIGVNSMAIGRQAGEGLAFAVAIDHAAPLLNGTTPVAAAVQTPLMGLNQIMNPESEGDQRRTRGEQQYAAVLQNAARAADQVDESWNRLAKGCVASATHTGDRPWLAVLEQDGVRITGWSDYDCDRWLDGIRGNASKLRTAIDRANEAARHDGVFPGTIRDLRRRYRLEWSGWER